MPLRVETRDLGQLTGPHHQLMANDQFADLERLGAVEAYVVDRILRPTHLADDVTDWHLGKGIHKVLGQRRPVRMSRAAARQWCGSARGRGYREDEGSGRLSHVVLQSEV